MTRQPASSFAELLQQLRAEAGLTQEELAQAARLAPRTVSDLERGIHRTAHQDTARLLADALGLAGLARGLFVAAARGRAEAAEVLAARRDAPAAGAAAATEGSLPAVVQVPPAERLHQPGNSGQRLAGRLPQVWNVPARNPGFTGRGGLLTNMRDRLLDGGRAAVLVLCGMGGVGKTQLATEYAHRFAEAYDRVWWIDAEQNGLIGDQFAGLGAELACVEAGAPTERVRAAVLGELRQRDRWLLLFDNAEAPNDVMPWLPGGGGHVLITSRERAWAEIATPAEVDVFARAESVAILRDRVPGLIAENADLLAAHLGDLPLAVAQAAGYLAEAGMSADEYLKLLGTRTAEILDQGRSLSYRGSLAAATQLIADHLDHDDPAAAELASLCAFLAPEPIPEGLFTGAAEELPRMLAARVGDPLAWRETLRQVTRQSLARIDHRGLQLNRLTQAILRDRLTPAKAVFFQARVEAILTACHPGDPENPMTWPRWARLMPHLLAADLGSTASLGLRQLGCDASWYLLSRGDARACRDLADRLHRQWHECLGIDNPHTLTMAFNLSFAMRELGEVQAARELDEDTLARRRRVLGEDHPSTLLSADGLGIDLRRLGEVQAARQLDEDTLARRRRVLGEDHPSTLFSANSLAADLREMGNVQAARQLDEDTLARRRRVLGEDHPDTLFSANSLAADLRELGEAE